MTDKWRVSIVLEKERHWLQLDKYPVSEWVDYHEEVLYESENSEDCADLLRHTAALIHSLLGKPATTKEETL